MTAVTSPSERSPIDNAAWPTDKAEFHELIARHEPAVFRGLASSWLPIPGTSDEATLGWLESILKNKIVPVSVGFPGDGGFVGTSQADRGRSIRTTLSGERPFSSLAADMRREMRERTGHILYMQSVEVDKALPEIKEFIKLPLEQCTVPQGSWRAWIGTGDHRVNLHYDGEENFFCMLAGRKRFSVAPFEVLKDLYVGPLNGPFGPPASLVDPGRPDLSKYPRFAAAQEQMVTIDLEPGDVLYLPAHWWHYVESFGFNVSVNYWWTDLPAEVRAAADTTFFNALLGVRGLPRHWREFWNEMFRQFVFHADGDPYAHLPVEHQGWAGAATPARLDEIRRQIAAVEQVQFAQNVRASELPSQRFRLAPTLRLKIESEDTVALRDAERGVETRSSLQMVAILARFATPQSPQDVLTAMREAGLEDHTRVVSDSIRELIANRMIVASDLSVQN